MFIKLKEFIKTRTATIIAKIKAKRRSQHLANFAPDLYCNVCKKPIRRGEFIAVIGTNKLLPALYAGSIARSYGWLLGCKKYCKDCFSKEYKEYK